MMILSLFFELSKKCIYYTDQNVSPAAGSCPICPFPQLQLYFHYSLSFSWTLHWPLTRDLGSLFSIFFTQLAHSDQIWFLLLCSSASSEPVNIPPVFPSPATSELSEVPSLFSIYNNPLFTFTSLPVLCTVDTLGSKSLESMNLVFLICRAFYRMSSLCIHLLIKGINVSFFCFDTDLFLLRMGNK